MIKLNRCEPPSYLTSGKVNELTNKFQQTGESVWNHIAIKESLSLLSFSKCAYCEIKLNQQSSYLEVEHFKDKKKYPNEVVSWDNLLPSCKRCNVHKSTHDVVSEPIVNPCDMDPKEHLYFNNYRFKYKTEIGARTILVLDLNNREHLVLPRCRVGTCLLQELEETVDLFNAYQENKKARIKTRLLNKFGAILDEAQPDALFSALSATIIHSSGEYNLLKEGIKQNGLWNCKLEELHSRSLQLVLLN